MRKSRRSFAANLGHSEFGGGPGLVQPPVAPDGSAGHNPTPSEVNAARSRLALGSEGPGDAETVEGDD
jgi:hypothetical protein